MNPLWLEIARQHLGTTEIPGAQHNSVILGWWRKLGIAIRDDETPYCAAYVGAVLEDAKIRSTRSAAARSYLRWGTPIDPPAIGAIVVYSRPGCSWCGHVGFVVGADRWGNVMTLGANQHDTVSIAAFQRDRVIGFRWPTEHLMELDGAATILPLLASTGKTSTNEA
jgi:uncharacterized protein (TIGR02594 family)